MRRGDAVKIARRGQEGIVYDPLDYESLRDPYPLYRRMRDQHPVYHNPDRGIWALTRFEDVQAASRDWETFSSTPGVDLDDFVEVLGPGSFIDLDPPRHDALRDVVRRHFAPSAIVKRESEIAAHVDALLDELLDGGEQVDLAADFAWQVPVAVISMLIGLPAGDRRQLSHLAQELAYRECGQALVPTRARMAARELRDYFSELLSERARRPAGDVLSELAGADRGGAVSFEETISICYLLFLAGIETTASLLSSSLKVLGEQPEHAAFLRAQPQRMPRAVEELLRYDAPVQQLARSTTRAVTLHDREIPAGARVVLVHGSANRDERRFPVPDVLDFEREVKRTLAFGEGIHFCLGAPLARPEARIALARFLERVAAFELCGTPQRTPTYTARGYARLPAAVTPARRGGA